MISIVLVIIVVMALVFDYVNGFHDTANVIATSVSTKALQPRQAIIIATSFNFMGALMGTAVAKTIGSGIVKSEFASDWVLVAALAGAIAWNIITWYIGIPSSSSHALIGGLVGAAISAFGIDSVQWSGFIKILAVLISSPVLGMGVGALVMVILFWIFRFSDSFRINKIFLKLQILSACMMAFAHGSNSTQKSMGIITLALVAAGLLSDFTVPTWVILACACAMACGTAVGGWRIIRTMGGKIFRLEPINGFAADFSSALVIYSASLMGMPVSTTHVVSSAIMGVGAAKRVSGVRWETAQNIVTAWLVTIPSAGLIGAVVYQLIDIII